MCGCFFNKKKTNERYRTQQKKKELNFSIFYQSLELGGCGSFDVMNDEKKISKLFHKKTKIKLFSIKKTIDRDPKKKIEEIFTLQILNFIFINLYFFFIFYKHFYYKTSEKKG